MEPLGRGARARARPGCRASSRFHAVVDTAELDEDRARDWVVVRMVHNAMWCVEDNPHGFDAEEQAYLTMCITLAKAVQD